VDEEAAARLRQAALRRMRIGDVRVAVRMQLAQTERGRHERSQSLLERRKEWRELRTRVRTNLRALQTEAATRRRNRQP